MFMAANSPLIQQRLPTTCFPRCLNIKTIPSYRRQSIKSLLSSASMVKPSVALCRASKSICCVLCCAQAAANTALWGAPASLSVCNQHRLWITCTCLQPDPGWTGTRARHLETLQFIGGSLKWFKFDIKSISLPAASIQSSSLLLQNHIPKLFFTNILLVCKDNLIELLLVWYHQPEGSWVGNSARGCLLT